MKKLKYALITAAASTVLLAGAADARSPVKLLGGAAFAASEIASQLDAGAASVVGAASTRAARAITGKNSVELDSTFEYRGKTTVRGGIEARDGSTIQVGDVSLHNVKLQKTDIKNETTTRGMEAVGDSSIRAGSISIANTTAKGMLLIHNETHVDGLMRASEESHIRVGNFDSY